MRLAIKYVLFLVFVSSPAFAQIKDVWIDNSSIPGGVVTDVFLTTDGELHIETSGEYQIVAVTPTGTDPSIQRFNVNNGDTTSIMLNQAYTVRWDSSNADSCTASSQPALSGWSGSLSPDGTRSVTFTTREDYVLDLTCSRSGLPDAVSTVTVMAGRAVITKFDVSPATVDRGADQTLTLDWESSDAEFCWGEPDPPWVDSDDTQLATTGTQNITVYNFSAPITFTLHCTGYRGEETTKTFEVAVNEPPARDCTRTLSAGSELRWDQVFRLDWPGPKSEQVTVRVPRTSYVSLEFNTRQVNDTGKLINIEAAGTEGSRLGALSRCPGDFDVEPECKYLTHTYAGAGILWATTGAAGYCQLEKDTTYYWNTTFTDGVNPSSTECLGTYCFTTVRVWNSDYQ